MRMASRRSHAPTNTFNRALHPRTQYVIRNFVPQLIGNMLLG